MKTQMNKIYINSSRVITATFFLLMFSGILNLTLSHITYAWCEQNANINDRCLAENYDSIPDTRGVTATEFKKLAEDCKSGEPEWLDWGSTDQGTCNNAVTSCIEKMVNIDDCRDKNNLASIAYHCDEGKTGGNQSCSRIRDKNAEAFNQAKADAEEKATAGAGCTVSGNQTQQFDQREACKKAVNDECPGPDTDKIGWYNPDKTFNQYGLGDYQKCLDSALKSTATDAKECAARGGNWVGGTDGAQAPRCADPTPVNPCEGHGGVNPEDSTKCNDGTTNQDSNVAEGVHGNIMGPPSTCGAARTNLIACKGKGEQALGDVLKIIISVLTVIIGIAATGGLAWASILYAKAEDIAGNVSEAKTLIRNIVIGILLYGFMVAIVNWLVPGGVIG